MTSTLTVTRCSEMIIVSLLPYGKMYFNGNGYCSHRAVRTGNITKFRAEQTAWGCREHDVWLILWRYLMHGPYYDAIWCMAHTVWRGYLMHGLYYDAIKLMHVYTWPILLWRYLMHGLYYDAIWCMAHTLTARPARSYQGLFFKSRSWNLSTTSLSQQQLG